MPSGQEGVRDDKASLATPPWKQTLLSGAFEEHGGWGGGGGGGDPPRKGLMSPALKAVILPLDLEMNSQSLTPSETWRIQKTHQRIHSWLPGSWRGRPPPIPRAIGEPKGGRDMTWGGALSGPAPLSLGRSSWDFSHNPVHSWLPPSMGAIRCLGCYQYFFFFEDD